MSKKSKRQVRKVTASSVTVAPSSASTAQKPSGLNTDYSYVIKDLKRIGILAGSFVALLVIISFFLR